MCEDCTAELVMVAKFREKCDMSAVALDRLRQQINKICKPVTINHENTDAKDSDSNSNQYYDQLEYTEENVEYVIYDSGTEFIEEADITDRPQEISKSDDIDTQNNQSITYTSSETITNEVCVDLIKQQYRIFLHVFGINLNFRLLQSHLKK